MNIQNTLLIFIFLISLNSCQEKSSFISNCSCNKIEVENGITISDSLNRYKITYPNNKWMPAKSMDELGNRIEGVVFEENSFRYFGVNELPKNDKWQSQKEQQKEIESKFNVIESGKILLNGKESLWNFVDEENDSVPTWTLYLITEHPSKNLFYTLNLALSKDKYDKVNVCELENLVNSFELIE